MPLLLSEIQHGEWLVLHRGAEIFSGLETTLDRTQQHKSDTVLMYSHGSVVQLTSLCSMFGLECLISESLLITQQGYNTPPLTFSVLTRMSFSVLILGRKIKIAHLQQQKKKIIQFYDNETLKIFLLYGAQKNSIKMSSCINLCYLFLD